MAIATSTVARETEGQLSHEVLGGCSVWASGQSIDFCPSTRSYWLT
jgi:hypothetical protein